jgi:hypothetical protein
MKVLCILLALTVLSCNAPSNPECRSYSESADYVEKVGIPWQGDTLKLLFSNYESWPNDRFQVQRERNDDSVIITMDLHGDNLISQNISPVSEYYLEGDTLHVNLALHSSRSSTGSSIECAPLANHVSIRSIRIEAPANVAIKLLK